jgi:hypothetical protein
MERRDIRSQTHATESNQFGQISRFAIVSGKKRPRPLHKRRTVGADQIDGTRRVDSHRRMEQFKGTTQRLLINKLVRD